MSERWSTWRAAVAELWRARGSIRYAHFMRRSHIPFGFGVAYFLTWRAEVVLLPIPFNVVVRFVVWAWFWVLGGALPASSLERRLSNAYDRGYRDGREDQKRLYGERLNAAEKEVQRLGRLVE